MKNPERLYLEIITNLLREIKLKSLALPKNPLPAEHVYFGNYYRKPHGVEFWIKPSELYTIQRNIIYKLQEENIIKVIDEARGDLSYEGTRFIVQIEPNFEGFYKLHEKGEKISKKLENENYWVQANFQDGEIHLFIGQKEDDGKHVHIILGKTGELRVDSKDQAPPELLKQILSITIKDGKKITAELKFDSENEDAK